MNYHGPHLTPGSLAPEASFPEVHETDELSFASKERAEVLNPHRFFATPEVGPGGHVL